MKTVTIFGATGYVGKHITNKFLLAGYHVNIVARSSKKVKEFKNVINNSAVTTVCYHDINEQSVHDAVKVSDVVINLVGVLMSHKKDSYYQANHLFATKVAEISAQYNIHKFIHFSAIGANIDSKADYMISKGKGEHSVLHHIPNAVIFRPSLILGQNCQFLKMVAKNFKMSPFIPLFGEKPNGAKLQPIYIDDLAEAVFKAAEDENASGVFELGGKEVLTWRSFNDLLCQQLGIKRQYVFLPKWLLLLSGIPKGVLDVSGFDNVVTNDVKTIGDLDMEPKAISEVISKLL